MRHIYICLKLSAEIIKSIQKILSVRRNCLVALSATHTALSRSIRIGSWISLRHWISTLSCKRMVSDPFLLLMLTRRVYIAPIWWNVHTLVGVVIIELVVEQGTRCFLLPIVVGPIILNIGINDFLLFRIFDSCYFSFSSRVTLKTLFFTLAR